MLGQQCSFVPSETSRVPRLDRLRRSSVFIFHLQSHYCAASHRVVAPVHLPLPFFHIFPSSLHLCVIFAASALISPLSFPTSLFPIASLHSPMPLSREDITKRAAQELQDGYIVNLGIGMPTLVANHIPDGMDVWLQSENGLLGIGPFPTEENIDADLINAGKQTITARTGSASFASSQSFAMIRGGHIDMCILGAMQISQEGDIANWMIPGKMIKGMGGAMDLVAGVKKVVVTMEHCNRKGEPKILKECTLPLTGKACIDMIITDLCVLEMDHDAKRYKLTELAPGVTVEEVIEKTEAELIVVDSPVVVAV